MKAKKIINFNFMSFKLKESFIHTHNIMKYRLVQEGLMGEGDK